MGLQSRVNLLQDLLSKAHSGGESLALSEDNSHVRVPRKRQHTQKGSFSFTKCQYTKPQKRKNLNTLLKDDDGPALAGRPALLDREIDAHIKDANRNTEERSGDSREKAVTVDLLLFTDNYYIPNGLYKENIDDILIDNQAANEAIQQFGKANHLPSGTLSKGQNISGLAEINNICAPAAPVVEPVSRQSKQGLKPTKRRKKGSVFTKKQRKEASKTPAAEEKEGTPSDANKKTGGTPSAAAMEKTESTPSGVTGWGTMIARSAGEKRKTGNEPEDTKKCESGSKSAASKEEETEKPSSAAMKQKTENPSSAANKRKTKNLSSVTKEETENSPLATKETESAPLNLKIEKAVLVAVNSRSQRVRKPNFLLDEQRDLLGSVISRYILSSGHQSWWPYQHGSPCNFVHISFCLVNKSHPKLLVDFS